MDDSRTVWCGNLPSQITEELLYELFLQLGPLERVSIPTDKEGRKSNFGFVTFKHVDSVDYAVKLLEKTKLFGQNVVIKPRSGGNQNRRMDRNPPRLECQTNYMEENELPQIRFSYNDMNNRMDYNRKGNWGDIYESLHMQLSSNGMNNRIEYNRKSSREDRYRDNHNSHRRLDFHERKVSPDARHRPYNDNRGRNYNSGHRRNNRY